MIPKRVKSDTLSTLATTAMFLRSCVAQALGRADEPRHLWRNTASIGCDEDLTFCSPVKRLHSARISEDLKVKLEFNAMRYFYSNIYNIHSIHSFYCIISYEHTLGKLLNLRI